MSMSRFRIICGNSSHSLKLIDLESGTDLTHLCGITDVKIHISLDNMVTAEVEMYLESFEINTDNIVFKARNPMNGKYEELRYIKFKSGAYLDFNGMLKIGES